MHHQAEQCAFQWLPSFFAVACLTAEITLGSTNEISRVCKVKHPPRGVYIPLSRLPWYISLYAHTCLISVVTTCMMNHDTYIFIYFRWLKTHLHSIFYYIYNTYVCTVNATYTITTGIWARNSLLCPTANEKWEPALAELCTNCYTIQLMKYKLISLWPQTSCKLV